MERDRPQSEGEIRCIIKYISARTLRPETGDTSRLFLWSFLRAAELYNLRRLRRGFVAEETGKTVGVRKPSKITALLFLLQQSSERIARVFWALRDESWSVEGVQGMMTLLWTFLRCPFNVPVSSITYGRTRVEKNRKSHELRHCFSRRTLHIFEIINWAFHYLECYLARETSGYLLYILGITYLGNNGCIIVLGTVKCK